MNSNFDILIQYGKVTVGDLNEALEVIGEYLNECGPSEFLIKQSYDNVVEVSVHAQSD